MTILARFVGLLPRRLATDTPARFLRSQAASAFTSGPAPNTATTPNADGLALLQARRQALLTEASRQKNLRRSKQASRCEDELRRVTHQILRSRIDA